MKKPSLLRRSLSRLYQLAASTRAILNLTPDPSLRRKFLETYFRTFFLGRLDREKRVARIAGYPVRYCTEKSLKFLFDEIFVRQDYLFSAETARPFILDCGSNIGMSVLYFKLLYPQSEITAFEPDRETFACLEWNVRENSFAGVTVHPLALSNREGELDFYYDPADPGSLRMSAVWERMPRQKQVVPCTRLSKFIDREVDLLKLDVEGVEMEILEDLQQAGKLGFVKQMVLEYHHHIHRGLDEFSKVLDILEKAGFGYQVESTLSRPLRPHEFQDILVFAYQKKS
ncbi:MAG TPA: FkbM family methyltransferase [Anaerolineales bacterium]|nr:FkbM family methyltransferase [Anaerolineales bacterium]